MAKMHQLLAVEGDVKTTFLNILKETEHTFVNKKERFHAHLRELKMFDDETPQPEERKALDETVPAKLKYQQQHIVRYMDLLYQKDMTNQAACADIKIDGQVIAENIPATYLLGLETILKRVRATYAAIPTLPPGVDWDPDETQREGVYKRRHPLESHKTKKEFTPQILYAATKEHPAQVDKIEQTINVGLFTRHEWCSMISVYQKVEILAKIDKLTRAVKRALKAANSETVVTGTIGQKLFDFINS